MKPAPNNREIIERSLIVLGFVLVIILSSVREVWAALDAPWYSPYIVWAFAIGLSWWLQRYLAKHEL